MARGVSRLVETRCYAKASKKRKEKKKEIRHIFGLGEQNTEEERLRLGFIYRQTFWCGCRLHGMRTNNRS